MYYKHIYINKQCNCVIWYQIRLVKEAFKIFYMYNLCNAVLHCGLQILNKTPIGHISLTLTIVIVLFYFKRVYLSNKESFFQYYEVRHLVGTWSYPVEPEGLNDRIDHTPTYIITSLYSNNDSLFLYNFQQLYDYICI